MGCTVNLFRTPVLQHILWCVDSKVSPTKCNVTYSQANVSRIADLMALNLAVRNGCSQTSLCHIDAIYRVATYRGESPVLWEVVCILPSPEPSAIFQLWQSVKILTRCCRWLLTHMSWMCTLRSNCFGSVQIFLAMPGVCVAWFYQLVPTLPSTHVLGGIVTSKHTAE